jgi:putative phosphoribosyl transferase
MNPTVSTPVYIPIQAPQGQVDLAGDLVLPADSDAIAVFVHGSGSSRLSPRNQRVARALQEGGLGTLLFDLLTAKEESADLRTGELRFDIALLASRLVAVTDWLRGRAETREHGLGYFGASTGAAAALVAAAERPDAVGAIVSRGGRPDLAGRALGAVSAPTLLIVGGADRAVIPLNEAAYAHLRCEKRLEIVPGATHLFEEAGALDEVARLAMRWFKAHLGPATPGSYNTREDNASGRATEGRSGR